MASILFSVVIPSHNRPEFLKRAVSGLERQTFPKEKFEIIIVLSPNDTSFDWLNNYKSSLKMRFIAPQEDKWRGTNVSFKRNFGAMAGVGSWIAFLDDDCVPQQEWLASAFKHTEDPQVYGIEGSTVTPSDSPKTLTWKGLQHLAVPGGYQTCNIFYRKEVFTQISNGFDSIHFPWFLEDTDLAWSVLDAGKTIVYEAQCLVVHPVGPSANWRLIHEAKGTGLKVKLFLKHPKQYEATHTKTLRLSQYIYFVLLSAVLLSVAFQSIILSLSLLGLLLSVLLLHMIKLFWKLQFTLSEVFGVAWRTVVFPFIALWSLWVEKNRSNLPLSTFLKLLKP